MHLVVIILIFTFNVLRRLVSSKKYPASEMYIINSQNWLRNCSIRSLEAPKSLLLHISLVV